MKTLSAMASLSLLLLVSSIGGEVGPQAGAGLLLADDTLYVKVESLAAENHVALVDAVEWSVPTGSLRIYADRRVREDAGGDGAGRLGPPRLLQPQRPDPVQLTGETTVVVAIDLTSLARERRTPEARVSVFMVDGIHYPEGEPSAYRVSVSDDLQGGWRLLGTGAGSMIFPLEGAGPDRMTDAELARITALLADPPELEALPPEREETVLQEVERIRGLDDLDQVTAELLAFHRMLQREHLVYTGDIVQPYERGARPAALRLMEALEERRVELVAGAGSQGGP